MKTVLHIIRLSLMIKICMCCIAVLAGVVIYFFCTILNYFFYKISQQVKSLTISNTSSAKKNSHKLININTNIKWSEQWTLLISFLSSLAHFFNKVQICFAIQIDFRSLLMIYFIVFLNACIMFILRKERIEQIIDNREKFYLHTHALNF